MDWKQHIEAYPEHAGLSPYVQRAEKPEHPCARLPGNERQSAYTSGLINEKDPERSQALISSRRNTETDRS